MTSHQRQNLKSNVIPIHLVTRYYGTQCHSKREKLESECNDAHTSCGHMHTTEINHTRATLQNHDHETLSATRSDTSIWKSAIILDRRSLHPFNTLMWGTSLTAAAGFVNTLYQLTQWKVQGHHLAKTLLWEDLHETWLVYDNGLHLSVFGKLPWMEKQGLFWK